MLPASRSLLIRSCRALPRRLQLNSVSASPAGRIPLLSSTHIASQKHQMSSSASAPPLPTAGIAASTAAPAAKNGAGTGRSYADAIEALNTLQSNAAVIEAIRKSGGRLNDFAIPEMVEYLTRIGHQVNSQISQTATMRRTNFLRPVDPEDSACTETIDSPFFPTFDVIPPSLQI